MANDNTPGPQGRLLLGLGLAAGELGGLTLLRRRTARRRLSIRCEYKCPLENPAAIRIYAPAPGA
jgi:hypothetical protein